MNSSRTRLAAFLCAASIAFSQQTRQERLVAAPKIPVADSMIHLRIEAERQIGNVIEYTVRGERGNAAAGRVFASTPATAEELRFDAGSRLSANTVHVDAYRLEEAVWSFFRLGPAVTVDGAGHFQPYTNGVYRISDAKGQQVREVTIDSLSASLLDTKQRLVGSTYELATRVNVREQGLYSLQARIAGTATERQTEVYLLPGEHELTISIPGTEAGQILRWDSLTLRDATNKTVAAVSNNNLAGLAVSGSNWDLNYVGPGAPVSVGTLTTTTGSDLRITGDDCCFGAAADTTYFASQTLTGDGTLTGKLTEMTSANGRAGIMLRNDLTPGSAMMAVYLSEDLNAYVLTRNSAGQTAVTLASLYFDAPPYWFKLTRVGNTVSFYISSDGASWRRLVANYSGGLNSTVQAGFFANGGANFENPGLTPGLTEAVAVSGSLPEIYSMNGTGAKLRVTAFGPSGTGALTFSAQGLPAGVTATFSAAAGIRGSTASTVGVGANDLVLTAASSVPQGTYPVTIRATDGTRSGSVVVQLRVMPGFNVEWPVNPNWLLDVPSTLYGAPRVVSGTSSSYSFTVPVTFVGGYTSPVSLYAGDDISLSRGIAPSQVSVSNTNVGVSIKGDALKMTNGMHYLKFQAIASGMAQQLMIPIELGPDFLMCCIASPAMTVAAGGNSSSYTLESFTRTNGHADPIQLSISGFPAGVTANFGTNPVNSTNTSSVVFSATSSVTAGTYSGFIVQTSASVTRMTPWSLQVTGGTSSFSVSASPASTTVGQGATATLTGSFTQAQGSSTAVSFSVTGLPTGATAAFNPVSRTASGAVTITITTTASTPAGTYSLIFRGTAGTTVKDSTPVTLIVSPTMSVQASPTAVNIRPGGTASVSLNVANAGTAALSVAGLPAGVTASFSPASVSGSGSSVMTLTAATTAAAGTATLTVSAVDGTTTKTTTVSLTIQSYSLSATPASATVAPGATASYTVALSMLNGFNSSVTFAATGLPSGATAAFNPASMAASGNTTLTVSTTASVAAGTYPVTITGTSGTISKTASVTLVVSTAPASSMTVARSAATLTVIASRSASNTITVANAASGTTTLAVSGLPAGATAAFSPASLAPNGTTTLTIATSANTPGGSSTVTVTATNGTTTATTTFTLTVQNFTVSNPASITVARGKSGSTTVTLTMAGGFANSVAFSVVGLPTGVTASYTPTSRTTTGTSTLKLTVRSTATVGTYALTVRGTYTGSGFTVVKSAPLSLTVN